MVVCLFGVGALVCFADLSLVFIVMLGLIDECVVFVG